SRSMPSAGERTPASVFNAASTSRLARIISRALARHTVHVMTDASASPINTAFTTGSALRYIPQGLRFRGNAAVAMMASCARAIAGMTAHAIDPFQEPSIVEPYNFD